MDQLWNRPLLEGLVVFGDTIYDAGERLLVLDHPRNVHTTHLPEGPKHPTRESLYYAIAVLALAKARDESLADDRHVARACDMIDRVLGLQQPDGQGDRDESDRPRAGLWHYFLEERVTDWPFPDFNWADFNGMSLLLIRRLLPQQFAAKMTGKLDASLALAANCIRRRDVDPGYTNIALKGTLVTLAVAELAGDAALFAYASSRLHAIHHLIVEKGQIAEYNSPTYSGVCLGVLMAMDQIFVDPGSRALAREIQHRFWMHVARSFHVPSQELAGPHSRTYSDTLREQPGCLGALIERVTQGRVRYPRIAGGEMDPFAPLWACVLAPDITAEALVLLCAARRRDTIRETTARFPEGSAQRIATRIEPAYALGSVNFQDGWEQRHNLFACWRSGEGPGYLRQHYDHDARPCCSGYFAADQGDGEALFAAFPGRHGDEHVSLKVDGVTAAFLGSVIDLNFGSETPELFVGSRCACDGDLFDGDKHTFFVRYPHLWIAISVLQHLAFYQNRTTSASPALQFVSGGVRILFAHYQGEPKLLDWRDFSQTRTVCGTVLREPEGDWNRWCDEISALETRSSRTLDGVSISWNGRTLHIPNTPLDELELRSFYRDR